MNQARDLRVNFWGDLGCQYLLLINSAASRNAETDDLDIPTTYSQMEGTALRLV